MMNSKSRRQILCKSLLSLSVLHLLSIINPVWGCTGIQLRARDGSIVYARTLEFGSDLHSQVLYIPRNHAFQGIGPDGDKNGLAWKNHFAIVGANAFDQDIILDGMNEKGLAVGLFYLPGFAQYEEVGGEKATRSVTCLQLGVWLLSNFGNIAEVKAGLPSIFVNTSPYPEQQGNPPQPLHYNIHDAAGNALVIEFVGGEMHVYDNPIGVLTNSPTFDWHITNLRNYINLSPLNVPAVKLDGLTLGQLGQGSGLLGLPGDYTPPSRFIRAVAYSKSSIPVATADEAVDQAFHILDNFDIPRGSVRGEGTNGKKDDEYTLWTSANDLRNKRFYFHTAQNRQIRMIEMSQLDPNGKDILRFSMDQPQAVQNLTGQSVNKPGLLRMLSRKKKRVTN